MKRTLITARLFTGFAVLALSSNAGAAIHRVRAGATGLNNGTSWANARTDLHAALLAAAPGDSVWIAAGTWHADWNAITQTRTGDRERRFTLKTGVTVLGGFAGTETSASQRDWWNNRTILSGEAGVPGTADNTRSIMATPISSPFYVAGSIVDGITFVGGRADNPQEGGGGDLIGGNGGALYLRGEVIVQNCIFLGNSATYGGAIKVSSTPSRLRLRQCLFAGNAATYVGGGVDFHSWQQPLEVTACTFTNNSASRGSAVGTNSPVNATWRGNVITSSQYAETGFAGTVTEWNVWPQTVDPTNTANGNVQTGNWPFVNTPSTGSDGVWGTTDDVLLLALAAQSAAVNLVPVAALPPDVTDADGDGNVTEALPYDLSHRQRTRDAAVDAGAFEMVNEAPESVIFAAAQKLEAEPVGTVFGVLGVHDPNGPGHTLSLVAGAGDTDNALFQIDGTLLRTAAVLDYETKPAVSIRVRAVDPMGLSVEGTLTISVINRAERTLTLEVLKASAWEPAGGVSGRTGPGGWPEHWAVVRLVRTGDAGALHVELNIDDRTFVSGEDPHARDDHSGREFRILAAGGEIYPADWSQVLSLGASENEVLLGIEPLFDNAPDESPGEVHISLPDGGVDYQTGTPSTAVVTIYDSPSRAWAALPDRAAIPAASLAAFALCGTADGVCPGIEVRMLSSPPRIEITSPLNPAARDISLSWEYSTDLLTWTAAAPQSISFSGGTARWSFAADGPRAWYRPRGAVSAQATGFGAGISRQRFAFIPAGGAVFEAAPGEPGSRPIRYQQLRPFWIARAELTGADLAGLMVYTGSPQYPLTGVGPDLSVFLAAAQQLYGPIPPGYELRLPTEAEWLYAASHPAGAPPLTTPLTSRAWYLDNAFGIVHRPGMKLPDARGLYDMLGNVSEWTRGRLQMPAGATIADETSIVPDNGWPAVCGGHVLLGEYAQKPDFRYAYPADEPSPFIGFRLVIAPVLASP